MWLWADLLLLGPQISHLQYGDYDGDLTGMSPSLKETIFASVWHRAVGHVIAILERDHVHMVMYKKRRG